MGTVDRPNNILLLNTSQFQRIGLERQDQVPEKLLRKTPQSLISLILAFFSGSLFFKQAIRYLHINFLIVIIDFETTFYTLRSDRSPGGACWPWFPKSIIYFLVFADDNILFVNVWIFPK